VNAWIITAGSDSGVMKLVGEAFAKQDVRLPLIGVFPWGVTNGRERLDAAVGKEVSTPWNWPPRPCNPPDPTRNSRQASYSAPPASGAGAPLNPHHTHFILVDNGKEGGAAWGSEISLRAEFEATISNTKNVPIVQLVVQGGPGTLQTVESTALEGKPVVILSDSGGAATASHAFCLNGIDDVEEKFKGMVSIAPRTTSAPLSHRARIIDGASQ
jgi:transient receptor potential cation channel subfamily M protein 2